jgi:MarR-like DNA-binding transcriptional regulator SgrR of sgrS sRNA
LLGAPVTIDPVYAHTLQDQTLVGLMFDTLYRVDDSGQVLPHLARALPVMSQDGKTARIPLLSGIRFHDGSALTAKDVMQSLTRARRGAAWLLAAVARVTADTDAVVVHLVRPTPELAWLLTMPQSSVTPSGQVPRWQAVNGTGPFRLETFNQKRREARLARFEDHFAGAPYLERMTLRWYEAADAEARDYEAGINQFSFRGEVAFAGHRPKYKTLVAESAPTILVYVGFGRKRPELASLNFRRAIHLAIRRASFRNMGTGEQVELAPYPIANNANDSADRMAEARAMLARALSKPAENYEVLVDKSRPGDREIAEKVSATLFQLGLPARISDVSPREFAERTARGDCDFFIGQLGLAQRDERMQMAMAFAAAGDPWPEQRGGPTQFTMEQATAAWDQRLPLVPLFRRALRIHHWDNVHGITLDALSRLDYADVFVFGPPQPNQ